MLSSLLADSPDFTSVVEILQSFIDSLWIPIIAVLGSALVIWGIVIGVKIAIANKNEEKVNAKDMIKQLVIGILVVVVIAIAGPLIVNILSNWVADSDDAFIAVQSLSAVAKNTLSPLL